MVTKLEQEVFEELIKCNPGVTEKQLAESYSQNRFLYVARETPQRLYKPALVNIAPLFRLESLEQIELHDCAIADISPLSKLPSLKKIWISRNKTIITPCDFRELVNLSFLCLSDCSFTILKLDGLQKLGKVILRNCGICDLSPLTGLSALHYVWIGNNPGLRDLSPLSDCKELNEIIANDTAVNDLSPLKELPKLRKLTLSNTEVIDVSPLAEIPTLEMIWLYGTSVAEISCLAQLPKLNNLNLLKTAVTNLSAFKGQESILQIERRKLGKGKGKKTAAVMKLEAARLKAKAEEQQIFLHPCLEPAKIKSFEERYNLKLPKEYTAFLMQCGDGFDSKYTLSSLEQTVFEPSCLTKKFNFREAWIWENESNTSEARICSATQNGQLQLVDMGCGRTFRLIVSGSAKGEVWEMTDVGIAPYKNGCDFLDWLDDFLDRRVD